MRINPITKKEIKITARGAKFFIEFFVYELILLIAFLLSLRTIMGKERIYVTDYQKLSGLFPVVAITQLFVITMIIPVMTGAAIAGEKEKQTLLEKAHLLGHFGVTAMEQVIHEEYQMHWKGLRKDIE